MTMRYNKFPLVFVTVSKISKRKLMKYWLLLMKDNGRKLTCLSEFLIVSYKRNDNLSEILTSSCTNNIQITQICQKHVT